MDENELKIISELSKNSQSSQRHLSKASNLSLGMVNLILHRLVEKGYMKVKQLDGRRAQYMLTPKGFSEKVIRSASYVKSTLTKLSVIKEAIKTLLMGYSTSGIETIFVVGGGELATLVDLAHRELIGTRVKLSHAMTIDPSLSGNILFLFCDEESIRRYPEQKNLIDLHAELAGLLI